MAQTEIEKELNQICTGADLLQMARKDLEKMLTIFSDVIREAPFQKQIEIRLSEIKMAKDSCLGLFFQSFDCERDAAFFGFRDSYTRFVDYQFFFQEGFENYLIFEPNDLVPNFKPIGTKAGCEWAGFMVAHHEVLLDLSLLTEEMDKRLFTLLSLSPEDTFKALEKTKTELDEARARIASARRNERQNKKARK